MPTTSAQPIQPARSPGRSLDRKSTRLNSSHLGISYAVFCLKKKKKKKAKTQKNKKNKKPHKQYNNTTDRTEIQTKPKSQQIISECNTPLYDIDRHITR